MNIEQLEKFCDPFGGRDITKSPFNYGGYTWATNGKVLLRVPLIAGVRAEDYKIVANLFGSGMEGGGIALPAIPTPLWRSCPDCGGKGFIQERKCPNCQGEGEHECQTCGHSADCDRCKSTGYIPDATAAKELCLDCGGTGQNETLTTSEVGIGLFQNRYLRLLSDLPGLEFQPHGDVAPGRFRWEGGEGMIMPARKI